MAISQVQASNVNGSVFIAQNTTANILTVPSGKVYRLMYWNTRVIGSSDQAYLYLNGSIITSTAGVITDQYFYLKAGDILQLRNLQPDHTYDYYVTFLTLDI